MNRQDVSVTLPWMGAGTELLLRAVGALPDDALAEPSRLTGWTRAHVVGHLARNAEALTRLATWARTGVRERRCTPAASSARRTSRVGAGPGGHAAPGADRDRRDPGRGAGRAGRADLAGAGAQRGRPARSRRPRCPGCGCARCGCTRWTWTPGSELADLPPEVVDTLLDDATGTLSAKEGCPAVLLVATDREPRLDARPGRRSGGRCAGRRPTCSAG